MCCELSTGGDSRRFKVLRLGVLNSEKLEDMEGRSNAVGVGRLGFPSMLSLCVWVWYVCSFPVCVFQYGTCTVFRTTQK